MARADVERTPETGASQVDATPTWPVAPGEQSAPGISRKLKRVAHWLARRDSRYITLRLGSLLKRYGLTPGKAERRIVDGVQALAARGANPTFPTPGRVVDRHSVFLRELQAMGAELAVHGYDHLDFTGLSFPEAMSQFARASRAYRNNGIEPVGFRFPYLSRTDDLLRAIPGGMFEYSSNEAIWWNAISDEDARESTAVFDNLRRFYRAESYADVVSTPRTFGNLVEIPVSLPDDIQLYDGLKAGEAGVAKAWVNILRQTHARGELFVLMFHPELFDLCRLALDTTLDEAGALKPAVWVTQLRDVARWWREKADFAAQIAADDAGLRVRLQCSDRATVLIRHVDTEEPTKQWHGSYRVLPSRQLHLNSKVHPFIGVSPEVDLSTVSFLREQGYIVEATERPGTCSLYLEGSAVSASRTQVGLIDYIESTEAPLVRFWRWPDGARSALCITGDLDALSLMDYASRLFAR